MIKSAKWCGDRIVLSDKSDSLVALPHPKPIYTYLNFL